MTQRNMHSVRPLRLPHQLGYKEMGIRRYNADTESSENRVARLDGIIADFQ